MVSLATLIVTTSSEIWYDDKVDVDFLRTKGLYKTLSLALAAQNSIKIPPTLLMIDQNDNVLLELAKNWHLPLMIRLDYSSYPNPKPLGGIPLNSLKSLSKITNNLFINNCFPLLHPNINRFENIYSANVMLNSSEYNACFEIVGKSFDASDLRHGVGTLHEYFIYNLIENKINERYIIEDKRYDLERVNRAQRIARLKQYIKLANKNGYLSSSLAEYDVSDEQIYKEIKTIPIQYIPLNKSKIKHLVQLAWNIRNIIPILPTTKNYIGSVSLVPNVGWILWDIYGEWYKR